MLLFWHLADNLVGLHKYPSYDLRCKILPLSYNAGERLAIIHDKIKNFLKNMKKKEETVRYNN